METDDCPHGATKATCEWCSDDEQDDRTARIVLDRNIKRFFAWAIGLALMALAALTAFAALIFRR